MVDRFQSILFLSVFQGPQFTDLIAKFNHKFSEVNVCLKVALS